MSYVKAFQEASQGLSNRAKDAAWHDSTTARFEALTTVFGDCGLVAREYPNPPAVAHALVCQVADAYRREWRLINA